jgi:hypothetical protein
MRAASAMASPAVAAAGQQGAAAIRHTADRSGKHGYRASILKYFPDRPVAKIIIPSRARRAPIEVGGKPEGRARENNAAREARSRQFSAHKKGPADLAAA